MRCGLGYLLQCGKESGGKRGDSLDHGMVGFDNTLWHRPESENSKFELGLPGSYKKVGGQNIFELGLIYKKY